MASAARLGLLIVMVWPFLQFAVEYLIAYHTTSGLLPSFVLTVVDGVPDQIAAAFHEPLKAIALTALTAVMTRIAFGPRRHR